MAIMEYLKTRHLYWQLSVRTPAGILSGPFDLGKLNETALRGESNLCSIGRYFNR